MENLTETNQIVTIFLIVIIIIGLFINPILTLLIILLAVYSPFLLYASLIGIIIIWLIMSVVVLTRFTFNFNTSNILPTNLNIDNFFN